MADEIRCTECSKLLGVMSVPTKTELRARSASSPYSGMIGMLPADITGMLTSLLAFRCPKPCEVTESGSEKAQREKDDEQGSFQISFQDSERNAHGS